ncbi:HP1 family phage holin [Gallibacterium sp. AGMB14963]|uniref:HP1 family phage holin n=1 Tax=Gallibacterium faecale TaxID=3019086 RepID=UPI0022F19BCA|nr:HP1 family phage holin [Gallibacterium sp. AGMB14963]MDA3978603.1 HP1 family phage holin [Gallibacterium sp. AGMB14963]
MKMVKDMPIESQVYGWITAFFGALTISEWAVLIGIIATVAGYWRESRYKKRMLELEEIKAGVRDLSGKLINNEDHK